MSPVHPLLAELETRAGASDTDRAAWLAERTTGVTATEVKDLHLGNITPERLADIKLGRLVDTFAGNAFTEWGNLREPVIAEDIRGMYGIGHESRVFHAADNGRFLASPDGVGVDAFDDVLVVSEIKTSSKDLRHGSVDFDASGHLLQMTWSMRVTGARRCLYAVELREGRPGSFAPGPLSQRWIEYDAVIASQLQRTAETFLTVLDVRAAADWDPNEHDALGALIEADAAAQERARAARAAIEEYVASHRVTTWKGSAGSVSYALPAPSVRFDQAAFKAAHPDLFAEFQREQFASKPTLRVTPAKTKEESR